MPGIAEDNIQNLDAKKNAQDWQDPVPILLVDDREENLVALEAVLRHPGYKIVKAFSGEDALRYLLDNLPALILMDVQMPGLNGFETANIIKSSARTRQIPIIFVTAINTDERYALQGYDSGAIDYIHKPFDPHVLRSKVGVLADLHRKTEHLLCTERALREAEHRERERKIAELELRGLRREQLEQKRYRSLIEGIEHGFVWAAVPETLELSFMSPSAKRLTGFEDHDWLAEPGFFLRKLHPSDQKKFFASVTSAMESGNEVRLEHRMAKADGSFAWFHTGVRITPRPDDSGHELRGLSVDISQTKIAERKLLLAKRQSDALAQASLLLSGSLQSTETLQALTAYLSSEIYDFCAVETWQEKEETFFASALACRDKSIAPALRTAFAQCPRTTMSSNLDFQPKLWQNLSETEEQAAWGSKARASAAQPLHLRSLVRLPLVMQNRLVGVLVLGSTEENFFEAENLAFGSNLGSRVAAALESSRLYQEAETAIRIRDDFLSIASHELRTPLTPLKIHIQQLIRQLGQQGKEEPRFDRLTKMAENSHRQIERLSKLIENLLDIARISRGKLTLHLEEFDFAEMVKDVVSRFTGQLESVGCETQLQLTGPIHVKWDLYRVEQVLVNLITNAMKYAPGKPIAISLIAQEEEAVLRVTDHGIGIAPEDQKRIIQRFERAVSSKNFGGLGLGLFIVSQILEAHGGKITVESRPGEGCTFEVRLPLKAILENNSQPDFAA